MNYGIVRITKKYFNTDECPDIVYINTHDPSIISYRIDTFEEAVVGSPSAT